MPTSGDLIAFIADVADLTSQTVATHFRVVREAGHIRTGGRGLSAARMELDDVARLFLACLVSQEARAADRSFEVVWGAKLRRSEALPLVNRRHHYRHALRRAFFAALPLGAARAHTCFGDALLLLLDHLAEGRGIPEPLSEDYEWGQGADARGRPFAFVSIVFELVAGRYSVVSASIALGVVGVYQVRRSYRPLEASKSRRTSEGVSNGGRIRRTTTFDLTFLERLASWSRR